MIPILLITLVVILSFVTYTVAQACSNVTSWSWVGALKLSEKYSEPQNKDVAKKLADLCKELYTRPMIVETILWIAQSKKSVLRRMSVLEKECNTMVSPDIRFLVHMSRVSSIRAVVLTLPVLQLVTAVGCELISIGHSLGLIHSKFEVIRDSAEKILRNRIKNEQKTNRDS